MDVEKVLRECPDLCKSVDQELVHLASFPEMDPNPIIELDPEGNFTYLNAAVKAQFPDLLAKGTSHPLLSRWPAIRAGYNEPGQSHISLETEADGRFFHQTVCYVRQSGVIRIFNAEITEGKASEEALRESEERFRRAVLEAPFPIMLHADGGEILLINKIWFTLTGYDAEDIRTLSDWAKKAYGERWREEKSRIEALFKSGERTSEREFAITAKDGESRTWQFSSVPLGSLQDGRKVLMSMAQDVTERKRAESEVGESEERFRAMYEQAPIGIVMLDFAGHYLNSNGKLSRILGYSEEDLAARTFAEITHPDDLVRESPLIRRLVSGEIPSYSIEKRYIHKDGRYIWVRLTSSLVHTSQPYRFSMIEDITANKRAEEALQESESRFRSLSDSGIIGIAMFDTSGRISDANDKFLSMTGFSREDLNSEQLRWDRLTPSEWMPRTMEAIEEFRKRGRMSPYEKEYMRKDGSRFWGLFGGAKLAENHSGIAFVIDISETKKAEVEIKRLNEELKKKIVELELSIRELDAFSYSVSHDLRAPLRIIHGFAGILLDDYKTRLDENGSKLLQSINGHINRMDELIEGLLMLSRVGRKKIQITTLDLKALAEEVFADVSAADESRKVELRVGLLPRVKGDRALMRQVLANLLSNAVKFTRSKDPAIIELGIEGKGDENIFYVRDNGIGFNMKYSDKIFDVFQRMHHTREFEGTGIGLSIVRRIIERHGGRVCAEGKPNEGATFYFTLPADAREIPEPGRSNAE